MTQDVAGIVKMADGTNDNDVLITIEDVTPYTTAMICSDTGAMDVWGSMNGTDFYGPLSMADFGAVASDPVIVTAAKRFYAVPVGYRALRLKQNGAVAVTKAFLSYRGR